MLNIFTQSSFAVTAKLMALRSKPCRLLLQKNRYDFSNNAGLLYLKRRDARSSTSLASISYSGLRKQDRLLLQANSAFRLYCSKAYRLADGDTRQALGVCFGKSKGIPHFGNLNLAERRLGGKDEDDLNAPTGKGHIPLLGKSESFTSPPTWPRVKSRSSPLGRMPKGRSMRKSLKTALPNQFSLVHINKTKNNMHCVVSTMLGETKTLWSVSGGRISKIASGRRKSRYVQRMVFQATIEKLLGLDVNYLVLHCKGTITSKRYILKTFNSRGIRVILFKDMTNIAHNGAKPASRRRV